MSHGVSVSSIQHMWFMKILIRISIDIVGDVSVLGYPGVQHVLKCLEDVFHCWKVSVTGVTAERSQPVSEFVFS